MLSDDDSDKNKKKPQINKQTGENWSTQQAYKAQTPSGIQWYPRVVGWLTLDPAIRGDLGSKLRVV